MGKKKPIQKYGAPLYCAVWPDGDYVLVAGGGGKKSSGIANRFCILLFILDGYADAACRCTASKTHNAHSVYTSIRLLLAGWSRYGTPLGSYQARWTAWNWKMPPCAWHSALWRWCSR